MLLGTNLGDKYQNLIKAEREIESKIGKIKKKSSIYETAAWGKTDQPSFLNRVVIVMPTVPVFKILEITQEIEKAMGRQRIEKWKERIIDIDILYIDQLVITTTELSVPHPEIENRRFTLAPLNEIAPDFVHPKLNRSQNQLFSSCLDPLPVTKTLL